MDMVNRLIQIAKGIALSLGETCEAVVHDGDHRIAYIANGHISGREQGQQMEESVFKYFEDETRANNGTVVRLTAGMDSIVQAAGRCNRHAEQKEPAPVRLIRCTDERLRGLDDIVRGQNATTALLTAFSKTPEGFRYDLSSEEAIRFYYRRLYAEMEPGFQDDQTQAHGSLYHLLADNPRYADANCAQAERYLLRQAFRLAGSLFQVFDEDTRSLLVPYGRGRELQNTLRNAAQVYGQKDWAVICGCIDEAKGYCVSVYRYQLERLEALGAVTSLFDGGILLLSDGFYNEHTGFSLEAGTRDFQEV